MRPAFLLIALAHATAAIAEWPPVAAITFEGNKTTDEAVFMREMALGIGDPADPAKIEDSRQAILDLGLFRSVRVHETEHEAGVTLTIRVEEKRYLLPVPRLDASSDGDRGYGAQLRWNNLWGLNHSLNVVFERGQHSGDRLRESEDLFEMSYDAPYLFNGRDGIEVRAHYIDRIVPGDPENYEETVKELEVLLSRDFRVHRPRTGWIGRAGVMYQTQDTDGEFAPTPDGRATALVAGLDYSDLRYHVYSETGTVARSRSEIAHRGLMSDFSYRRLELTFVEHIAMPGGEHRSLILSAAAGVAGGGTGVRNTYGLGGSGQLRGYGLDFIEGERFAYGAVEYLHPIFGKNWLRLLALAEAGWTGGSVTGALDGGPYANVGVGFRIRVTWLVNVEFEAGFAYPLRGGDGMRVFAGGN